MLADDFLDQVPTPAPGTPAPASPNAEDFLDTPALRARATIYTRFDDGPTYYDGRTAKPNPLTGQARAQEGVTIAVDPAVIPYGSKVRIPKLAGMTPNRDGIFIAHDTGADVKSRKASGGTVPVIDLFVDGSDKEQAQKRRDALAKALGTDPLDYEIVESGQTAEDFLNESDNGKGRLASAGATFMKTAEEGVGSIVSGVGRLDQALGDALRGGDNAAVARERESLQQTLKRLGRLPDEDPAKARLVQDFTERMSYLDAMNSQMTMAGLQQTGTDIQEDAAKRFQPNPAYAGEFLADTVPSVAGSAVQSVAPFFIPGVGQASGVAAMFSQTFDQTVQENLDKGVDHDTAIQRGLLNGIVSGGLESVGDGIVAAAMQKLVARRGVGTALRTVGEATLAEGVTGAAQEATSEVIDQEKLQPWEIAKQGALEALGGFMLSGSAAGVGKAIGAATSQRQAPSAEAFLDGQAADLSGVTVPGAEGVAENDPLATAAGAPAPAAPNSPAPAAPAGAAPAPGQPGNQQGGTSAATLTRAELHGQLYTKLGFPTPALDQMSEPEMQAALAKGVRYQRPSPAAVPAPAPTNTAPAPTQPAPAAPPVEKKPWEPAWLKGNQTTTGAGGDLFMAKAEPMPADEAEPAVYPGSLPKEEVVKLVPFSIMGLKTQLIASDIGSLLETAARASTRTIDAFGGAGTYTHYLHAVGLGHEGDWLNELEPGRAITHRQIAQNPDAVADVAERHIAAVRQILGTVKSGDPFNEVADNIRGEIANYFREESRKIMEPGQDLARAQKDGTPVQLQDNAETAGWYYVAQNVAFNDLPIQSELSQKYPGTIALPGLSMIGNRDDKVATELHIPRIAKAREQIRGAAARTAGVQVTQADGWQVIAEHAGQGDLVTVDTSYLNKTNDQGAEKKTANYNKITEEDAIPAVYVEKIRTQLLPAWDRGAKLVITNNYDPLVAGFLRDQGFRILAGERSKATGAENRELIAVNFNPNTGQIFPRRNAGDRNLAQSPDRPTGPQRSASNPAPATSRVAGNATPQGGAVSTGGLTDAERAEALRLEDEARLAMEEELRNLDQENGGTKLSDALRTIGYLPSPDSPAGADFAGELRRLQEFHQARRTSKNGRARADLPDFFKGTKSLDHIAELLREQGFATWGPDDVLDLVEGFLNGTADPVGFEGVQDDNVPFSQQPGSADARTQTFYSQLAKTIESLPQETLTVAQAIAAIEKGTKTQPPAKADEIAHTGLKTDPLSPLAGKQPNDKVKKQDLLDYAIERQATTEDVLLGEGKAVGVDQILAELRAENEEDYDTLAAASLEPDASPDGCSIGFIDEELGDLYTASEVGTVLGDNGRPHYPPKVRQAAIQIEAAFESKLAASAGGLKFESYQLPGYEQGSAREFFVTWPEQKVSERELAEREALRNKPRGQMTGEDLNRLAVLNGRALGGVHDSTQWQDGHGPYSAIKNPVVRLRYNMRKDASGRRVFFLEEMQGPSDHNQQKMPAFLRKRIYEIGMKKALRLAIDSGAEVLAWTNGTQQAERYSLERQVDHITVTPAEGGKVRLEVYTDSNDAPQVDEVYALEQLPEAVGKDLAVKIAADLEQPVSQAEMEKAAKAKLKGNKLVWRDGSASTYESAEAARLELIRQYHIEINEDNRGRDHTHPARVYKGTDLKVGGEGLKRLYDKDLPNIASKIAGKMGAKPSTVELPTSAGAAAPQFAPFDMNDEMAYAGAEDFANGDKPLRASTRVKINGEATDAHIVLAGQGLQLITEDGEPLAAHPGHFPGDWSSAQAASTAVDIVWKNPASKFWKVLRDHADHMDLTLEVINETTRQPGLTLPAELKTKADGGFPLFAQQPQPSADAHTSATAEEAARLRRVMRDQWKAVGERQGASIAFAPTAAAIPTQLAGEKVRAAVQSGAVVEAYFVGTEMPDGTTKRRIVVVRDGVATIAAQRGITVEKRVAQLALHEIVHHYGSLGALLPKPEQRRYNEIIDGLVKRLQREDPELLRYLTRPKNEGGYGYQLDDRADRAAIVEEYLARTHESTERPPGWWQKAVAAIKEILRRAFPKIAWTDNDVRTLLDQARRKADQASDGRATTKTSQQPGERVVAAAVRYQGKVYTAPIHGLAAEQIPGNEKNDAMPMSWWNSKDAQLFKTNTGRLISRDEAGKISGLGRQVTAEELDLSQQPAPRPAWLRTIDSAGNPAQPTSTDEDPTLHLGRSIEAARRLGSRRDQASGSNGHQDEAHALVEQGALAQLDAEAIVAGTANLRDLGRNEHSVVRPDGSSRVYKITKAGQFGARGDLATYLQRLQDSNELFADAIRLEGAFADPSGAGWRVVISQPWIEGARPATPQEIEAYFRAKGYSRHSDRSFYSFATGVHVSDAEGVNVLADKDGVLYPIDVIPTRPTGGRLEHIENIVLARQREAAGEVRMSAQPAGPEIKQRRYTERVQGDEQMAPEIRDGAASYYVAETTEAWRKYADDTIRAQGIDGAMRMVLQTDPRNNPATASTNALGMELVTRLQAVGRHEDAITIIRHVAEGNTTQAQAIRAMGLYGRLDAAGAQLYGQKLVEEAAQVAAATQDPTVEQLLQQIQRLREELAKARGKHATDAILAVQEMIKAAGWDAAKMTQVQQKMREILQQAVSEPGIAADRLRGLLIAAGMDRKKAEALAQKALRQFRKRLGTARNAMLRQLLKLPPDKIRVPKSQLEKWIALNDAGRLDDETIYGTIAQKFGLPIFTRDMAKRIKAAQDAYHKAPDGDLKLAAGARMMDEIHSMVPANFATKLRTFRNMAMLLNPKTILRNIGGNQVLMITDAAADTINGWTIDPMLSLFTGRRARTTAAVVQRAKGLAQPWHDFWKGVEDGQRQGHTGRLQLFADGFRHFRDMAKITNAAAWDVRHFRATFRHVFTSRTMRLMEDTLTIALGGGDRIFHAASYQASLANQMKTAARNGQPVQTPTPEMLEQALVDANRSILQDENVMSSVLLKLQRALNVVGIGKPIDPKTGATKWGEPGRFGLGNVILPFAQIPGGAITRGVEFSPLGFIRASYELLWPHLGRKSRFDQKAFGESLSRALVGTGGYALGAFLLKIGVMSALPDDDKDLEAMRKAAGLGGLRVNVSELKRRILTLNFAPAGSMFDAAQDGDLVVSYDWLQPASFTVAAGAQTQLEMRKHLVTAQQGKIPGTSTAMMAGLLGATRGFEHMSVLNGLRRFAQSSGQSESIAEATTAAIVEMPSSFVPTVVADLGKVLDNTLRETRPDATRHPVDAAIAATLSRLPGVSQQYPPRFDAFGQAMERYQYGGNSLFNVMVNPAFATHVRKTPQLRELERIYAATLDPNATPSTRSRLIAINGRQIELTNEELAQYKYLTGRAAAQRLDLFLAAPGWARLPDELKARLVGQAFSDAASAGKILLFGDRPERPDPGDVVAAIMAQRAGLTQPYPR